MYSSLLSITRLALLSSLSLGAVLPGAAQQARAALQEGNPPAGWPHLLSNGKQVTLAEAIQQRIVRPWDVIHAQHIDGWVLVRFTVTPEGLVKNARIAESLQYDCDVAALLAVRQLPPLEVLLREGKPVASTLTVPVRFNWRAKQRLIK